MSVWSSSSSASGDAVALEAADPHDRHTADVLVVGLGASGLAAVHAALDRGLSVVGIDAVGVAAGAAGRNGGFALAGLASFHHDACARLGRERAAAAYAMTLAELTAMEGVRRVGSLRIASSDEEVDDCRAHLAALAADGFPGEWYDGPEGVGVLVPSDGVMHPVSRCMALARDALARGATLLAGARWPTPLVSSGVTVVAVDGGLEDAVPSLRGRVRTTRLQMLSTAPWTPVRYERPVYRRYGYDYWQQLPTGEVVLGGCRDRFEAAEWDAAAAEPSDEVQACIERVLRDVVGVPTSVPVVARWAGRVGYTPDGLPVITEVEPGVVACGGYCGTGNVVGVLAARAALELALDGRSAAAEVLAGPASCSAR